MKLIKIFFSIVFIVGCSHQDDKASLESCTNKPSTIKSKRDLKGINSNQHSKFHTTDSSLLSNSDTSKIVPPDFNQQQKVKYIYFSDYSNKIDSINRTLKIAENVITFFIPNGNHIEIMKKFRNNGFPMEFWSTGGYSFFHIPYSELENKIAAAKVLGYTEFGYKCTLTTNGLTEEKILTSWIKIKFKNGTTNEVIHQILSDTNFIEKRLITNQSYQLRVKNQKPRSLIKEFRKLRSNDNIEQIEFVF